MTASYKLKHKAAVSKTEQSVYLYLPDKTIGTKSVQQQNKSALIIINIVCI